MKLLYLTPLTFPSRYVNRLQVMKMSGAFSRQVDFALYIAESRMSRNDLFKTYNIREPFRVEEVGNVRFLPRRLWQARRFLRAVKNAPPDTVWYVRDVLLADWLSFFSKQFRGQYFFELHTLSRFSEKRYRRVLSRARGIITTNEEKKKALIEEFSIAEQHILVAPNGVDFEEFHTLKDHKLDIRKEFGIAEQITLVVYAGTDAKEYGTDVLREASSLLPSNARVEIVSGKPRNEALKYMAAADVLVAPYLAANDHFIKYMSPMKIREYMAMERPMVVSDLPSIRAYLPTNEYAFFASAGDSKDLAHKINEALENKEDASKRAKNAYDMVWMGGFSWEERAKRIIDFIGTHI